MHAITPQSSLKLSWGGSVCRVAATCAGPTLAAGSAAGTAVPAPAAGGAVAAAAGVLLAAAGAAAELAAAGGAAALVASEALLPADVAALSFAWTKQQPVACQRRSLFGEDACSTCIQGKVLGKARARLRRRRSKDRRCEFQAGLLEGHVWEDAFQVGCMLQVVIPAHYVAQAPQLR